MYLFIFIILSVIFTFSCIEFFCVLCSFYVYTVIWAELPEINLMMMMMMMMMLSAVLKGSSSWVRQQSR